MNLCHILFFGHLGQLFASAKTGIGPAGTLQLTCVGVIDKLSLGLFVWSPLWIWVVLVWLDVEVFEGAHKLFARTRNLSGLVRVFNSNKVRTTWVMRQILAECGDVDSARVQEACWAWGKARHDRAGRKIARRILWLPVGSFWQVCVK